MRLSRKPVTRTVSGSAGPKSYTGVLSQGIAPNKTAKSSLRGNIFIFLTFSSSTGMMLGETPPIASTSVFCAVV